MCAAAFFFFARYMSASEDGLYRTTITIGVATWLLMIIQYVGRKGWEL
jgi:hypothetical protein